MKHPRVIFLRLLYAGSDLLMAFAAMVLFDIYRFNHLPEGDETRPLYDWLFFDYHVRLSLTAIPVLYVLLSTLLGYYNDVEHRSRLDDFKNSVVNSFICTLVVFFAALINNYLPDHIANYIQIIVLWGLLFMFPYIGRTAITLYQRRHLRRSGGIYSAVILGSAKATEKLRKRLTPKNSRNIPSFKVLDCLNPEEDPDIVDKIAALHPDAVILTSEADEVNNTMKLFAKLYPLGCSIHVSPNIYSMITSRTRITNVAGEPLINISAANMTPATANIKRLMDVVLSAAALILLSPVFAAVAIGVKLDSRGPVFYRQQRVGYHKRLFNIYKFRSMTVDAEAHGPALSSENDPRITRFGAVLRKYRLDELPQFWNVLRGDMSLVGPRPERPYFVEQIVKREPHYSLVHQVRPGLTSWGMVKFGYASSVDQMIERVPFDLLYIENVSIGIDLKIMFHTVNTIISGQGL
ncbi:MAG: sugar transferase [Muribaculaceae bacterium]|nr:sugar transferase [Muribaculaceae bacterium]